jgi:hypothetical protein
MSQTTPCAPRTPPAIEVRIVAQNRRAPGDRRSSAAASVAMFTIMARLAGGACRAGPSAPIGIVVVALVVFVVVESAVSA